MSELDGMAGVAEGVRQQRFPHTVDARVWVEEFAKQYPEIDRGTMLGWFANAIMAGFDTAGMRCSGEIEQLKVELAQARLATLEEVRRRVLHEQEEIIHTWEDDPTVPAHAHEPKVCNDRCDGYCIAINTMSATLGWLDQQIAEVKEEPR